MFVYEITSSLRASEASSMLSGVMPEVARLLRKPFVADLYASKTII
jgi:hypothetical protein